MTAAGPLGMRSDAVARAVRLPLALLVGRGQLGVGAEVARAAGDHARRSERSSIAMSSHSTAAMRSTFASIRSASRRRCAARPAGPERGPGRERVLRGAHGGVDLVAAGARDLGQQRPSIGERSSNVAGRHALRRRCGGRPRRGARDVHAPVGVDGAISPPSAGRHRLQVVDGVGEGEAEALAHAHGRERDVLLVGRAEAARARPSPPRSSRSSGRGSARAPARPRPARRAARRRAAGSGGR